MRFVFFLQAMWSRLLMQIVQRPTSFSSRMASSTTSTLQMMIDGANTFCSAD